jgi:hypothetical protein
MSAQNTDKLRKLSRRWVSQIGSGGVADAVATTIPLSSTTNLPTDTAVTLVIDRVDANGTATPTLEETIVGVVSGTNIVNAVRGVEGTAQAHSAGAVVEVLVTADGYNDIIDHLLVEHGQDGKHKSALVTTLKATGAEINTGTEDAKIVTPKALADSAVSTASKTETLTNKTLTSPTINNGTFTGGGALLSKIITFTRDGTADGEDVAYTGVGFTPRSITFLMNIDAGVYRSDGVSDSTKTGESIFQSAANMYYEIDKAICYSNQSSFAQTALVKSYDADGFTLTWAKVGSPIAGTMKIKAICYR